MSIKDLTKKLTQAHWLFAIIALIGGVFYVYLTPPLWGFDEVSHFNRSYQIAKGDFIPPTDDDGAVLKDMPSSLVELEYYVYADLMDNEKVGSSFRRDVANTEAYTTLTSRSFSDNLQQSPGVATYSPVAYIAPSIGVFVSQLFGSSIGTAIDLARLSSLFFYIVLVGFSIKILHDKKIKWLIFVVALMPMSLFQGAMVSADGMVIAISVLFISLFLRLVLNSEAEKSKKLIYVLAGAVILLPLVKINYLFLSLGILLIPSTVFNSKKMAVLIKVGSLVLMASLATIWSFITKVTSSNPDSPRPDGLPVVASEQIAYVLHNPINFLVAVVRSVVDASDIYIKSMTSYIGWNETPLPIIFILLILSGVVLAALYARQEYVGIRKKVYILSALAFVGILSIFGVLYVAFNPTGYSTVDGVQGRYFIPFIPFVAMLLVLHMPLTLTIKDRLAPYIFGAISITCLVASLIYYYLSTY